MVFYFGLPLSAKKKKQNHSVIRELEVGNGD